MNTTETPTAPRPSLTMLVAILVAFAALLLTSRSLLVPLIGLGLAGVYLSDARLQRVSFAAWIIRMIGYGLIAFANSGKPAGGSDYMFDARSINTIGEICAFELVLQCWRDGGGTGRGAVNVLLSGLVLLTACNTFDDRYVRFFVPVYLVLLLFALRDLRPGNPARSAWQPQLRRMVAVMLALVAGFGLHMGINNQREQIMMWVLRRMGMRNWSRPGISSQPTLGSRFGQQDAPGRVLIIEGMKGDGHWRAMAFDYYQSGQWGPPHDGRKTVPMDERSLREGAAGEHARVTHLVDENGLILAPLHMAGLVPAPGSEIEWNERDGVHMRTRDAPPYTYEVIQSTREGAQGPLCIPISQSMRQRCLQMPSDIDSKVPLLARRIVAGTQDKPNRIAAITTYLMTHHKYSQRIRRGSGDPVSTFLFKRKSAHCEYFASAAVILLRAVGIPARYVSGYYAHETDGQGVTTVRQRDAHAWTEAWLDGVGWVTVDATPGDGRPDAAPPVAWWLRVWETLQDRLTQLREFVANLSRGQLLMVAVALTALWGLERWRRRSRKAASAPAFSYHTPDEALAALAGRYEAMWHQRGQACPTGSTWQEHLTTLEATGEGEIPTLDIEKARRFLAGYNDLRFGRHLEQRNVAELEQLLSELNTAQSVERERRHSERSEESSDSDHGVAS